MKILVVVDMQKDFVDKKVLGSDAAFNIVPKVADKIKSTYCDTVILTKDTHTSDYLKTNEGKHLPIEHCIKGTPGWEICEDVIAAATLKCVQMEQTPIIVEKPTFGSFDLVNCIKDQMLFENCKEKQLEVELIGLCTDICVVSNALLLKAAFPEATIKVDGDCCAGVTRESHEAALRTMQVCQVEVNYTDDYVGVRQ